MSTIKIIFEGETLLDVAQQAADFAAAMLNGSVPSAPTQGERKGRTRPPVKPETPQTEADAKEGPEGSGEETVDPKALEKAKEEALDILRKVFGKGEAGQKAVRKITKDYGVKKAGDVPIEKAEELLGKAKAALASVEDAPI